MPELFLLQNQDKLFLNKQKEWVDGRDLNVIFKTQYKDEALNQLIEVNTKDHNQRIQIIKCDRNEKGLPIIDPEIMPPPIPKTPKELIDSENPQLDLAAVDSTVASSTTAESAFDETSIENEAELQDESTDDIEEIFLDQENTLFTTLDTASPDTDEEMSLEESSSEEPSPEETSLTTH